MAADSWAERVGDFVVGLFSPQRALVRKHWRSVERDGDYRTAYEMALRARGYRAAKSATNNTPWLDAANRSADGELLLDLPTLRARSRSAERDDALASGIYATRRRTIVGTGNRPQARTGDTQKDDALEAVWLSRADLLFPGDGYLPHATHQQVLVSRTDEDGEVLMRAAKADPLDPVWIETIEADRLRTPSDATPQDPAGRIVDGVEKDRFGRPVAYWIARRHPGDSGTGAKLGTLAPRTGPSLLASEFDRVPFEECYHKRSRVTRPGQTRGVPLLHACLQDLHDLDLLILAALKRTQVAACLAMFIKSDATASDLLDMTAQEYGYQLNEKIEPGMFFRLFPGEEAQFLSPNFSTPDLDKFVFMLARRIGAAVGMSAQAVLRAWDGINYSGARTIKAEDRLAVRVERADLAHCLTWEWRVVQTDALLRGDERLLAVGVSMEDVQKPVDWIGDEEQWVDPQAEASAVETMLSLGLTTVQAECAKLGRDWQEVVRERVAYEVALRDARKAAGLEETPAQAPKVLQGGGGAQDDEAGADAEEPAAEPAMEAA